MRSKRQTESWLKGRGQSIGLLTCTGSLPRSAANCKELPRNTIERKRRSEGRIPEQANGAMGMDVTVVCNAMAFHEQLTRVAAQKFRSARITPGMSGRESQTAKTKETPSTERKDRRCTQNRFA
jgi:hypothetical protein